MDFLIPIVVFALVGGIFAYFKIPSFKSFVNSKIENFKDIDVEPDSSPVEPPKEVLATPLSTPSKESTVEAVLKPQTPSLVSGTEYNGVREPASQEAWTAWRNKQPASTRAYIPAVWTPTPVDNPEFGPFPEDYVPAEGTKHGGFQKKVKLTTKYTIIPINHPKNFKGKLKLTVVEDAGSVSGTNVKYFLEIVGDGVKANQYVWDYKGGTINLSIAGDSHEIYIKADKAATCNLSYRWTAS